MVEFVLRYIIYGFIDITFLTFTRRHVLNYGMLLLLNCHILTYRVEKVSDVHCQVQNLVQILVAHQV